MTVGGTDYCFPSGASPKQRERLFQVARDIWPDACVEEDANPAKGVREFFVYQHPEAHESWDLYGRTSDNAEQMVYVIFAWRETTLVAEVEGPLLTALKREVMRWQFEAKERR